MSIDFMCGLDEVGRGALAGPLIAAAVILTGNQEQLLRKENLPLRDSKKLSALQREKIVEYSTRIGIRYKIAKVSARMINKHGIGRANREIFRVLIRRIDADVFIVDGNLRLGTVRPVSKIIRSFPNADATILPVMLAGIIAKVFRDKLMTRLHQQYPRYDWNRNAGYGTRTHIERLRTYGKSPQHRNVYVSTALGCL